jgi:Toprim-like
MNPQQPELVRAAVARMSAGSEIVAAMDADTEGRKLADIVRQAVELSGRSDLNFKVHEPDGFKDWNDQLRGSSPPCSFPTARFSVPDVG